MTRIDDMSHNPGSDIERKVQALISSLSEDLEGSAPPSDGISGKDRSMVIVPVDQHADALAQGGPGGPGSVRLRTIEHALVPSSPLIRARMNHDEPTVSMLEELGTIDDQPLFVRVSYHRAGDFQDMARMTSDPDLAAAGRSTAEAFFGHFETALGESQSSVSAVRSDNRTATALRVRVGTPMILREMLLSDRFGVPRELSFTHFRADRVALEDF